MHNSWKYTGPNLEVKVKIYSIELVWQAYCTNGPLRVDGPSQISSDMTAWSHQGSFKMGSCLCKFCVYIRTSRNPGLDDVNARGYDTSGDIIPEESEGSKTSSRSSEGRLIDSLEGPAIESLMDTGSINNRRSLKSDLTLPVEFYPEMTLDDDPDYAQLPFSHKTIQ